MPTQCSLFEGNQKFIFDKPVRLIELFAGYGSQHLALQALNIPFESYRICEWAINSLQAYKDLHCPDNTFDYSATLSDMEIVDFLYEKGISRNYNTPLEKKEIKRLGQKKQRLIYNNIRATHNLVNITKTTAADLAICNTDKFIYLLTYSFPCQDLSQAGKRKGLQGERSGLLFEVERLLKECKELPQMLLMENVPDVINKNNMPLFSKWIKALDNLGYKTKYFVLNSADYGIPQKRKRCFAVSILGDYYISYPSKVKLTKTLVDFIEKCPVPSRYYLTEKQQKSLLESFLEKEPTYLPTYLPISQRSGRFFHKKETFAVTLLTRGGKHFGQIPMNSLIIFLSAEEHTAFIKEGFFSNEVSPVVKENIKSNLAIIQNGIVRAFTERECFQLMGVTSQQFLKLSKHQSSTSLYHLAGDSIVVPCLVAILSQYVNDFDFEKYLNNFYDVTLKEF